MKETQSEQIYSSDELSYIDAKIKEYAIQSETGCLLWTGAIITGGYGRIRISGKGKTISRVMWEVSHCKRIPKNMHVCHTCDNPRCINPDHLWVGYPKDNVNDKVKKNRQAKGGNNGNSKLTDKQIKEIRLRFINETSTKLAKEYGIHHSTIIRICQKRTWKHISDQEIAEAFGYDEEEQPDVCPSGCQGGCYNCR